MESGFENQRAIVLPKKVIQKVDDKPLIKNLYLTDIGFYPEAQSHYRKRKKGISQHIVILCVKGKGWFKFKGKVHDVLPNQFFFLPAGEPHEYGASSENPWSIYWVHFKGAESLGLREEFEKLFYPKFLNPQKITYSINLFETMFKALMLGYSEENLLYSNMCLYHFLASFLFSNDNFQTIPEEISEPDVIATSIRLMRSKVTEQLSLQQLAEPTHYSVSHFSMLFRKRTGSAPMDYFLSLKMQHACHLLDFSRLRVREIGEALGYEDPFYFSRLFKKFVGIPPLQYRKQEKG